eukprot:scaffold144963_cov45-Prasinocladus_malaysianus.AAC.1
MDGAPARVLVMALDCAEGSVEACRWAVEFLCRPDDELHLVHVIPRTTAASAPIIAPGDLVARHNFQEYDQVIHAAERFISQKVAPVLAPLTRDPVVHMIKSELDTDTIGSVICRKAAELNAVALIVNNHEKSK